MLPEGRSRCPLGRVAGRQAPPARWAVWLAGWPPARRRRLPTPIGCNTIVVHFRRDDPAAAGAAGTRGELDVGLHVPWAAAAVAASTPAVGLHAAAAVGRPTAAPKTGMEAGEVRWRFELSASRLEAPACRF
ncbi:hypothetical protein ACP4OV_018549 [Aristida adscensionis]